MRAFKEIKEIIMELNCEIDKFATASKKNVEIPKTVSACSCTY